MCFIHLSHDQIARGSELANVGPGLLKRDSCGSLPVGACLAGDCIHCRPFAGKARSHRRVAGRWKPCLWEPASQAIASIADHSRARRVPTGGLRVAGKRACGSLPRRRLHPSPTIRGPGPRPQAGWLFWWVRVRPSPASGLPQEKRGSNPSACWGALAREPLVPASSKRPERYARPEPIGTPYDRRLPQAPGT